MGENKIDKLVWLVAALLAGAAAGFLLGRLFNLGPVAPSAAPLSGQALKKNWEQAISFDADYDGVVY